MNSRSRPLPTAAAALALCLGLGAPAFAEPAGQDASALLAGRQLGTRQVTLITGDQVTATGDRVRVEPGPGRRHVTFRTTRSKGRVTVIPSDVSGAVASGKLDRRLFDVTGLVEARYDDASTPAIPLIVTYQARAKRSAPAGSSEARDLPSVNGTAVKVAKKDAARFLGELTSARSTEVSKIWLDGRRRTSLDRSVPQIGAPVAWEAGFTGKDVPVAVLDTGVDSTHPDLAGRVAGAKDFTGEGPEDLNGHGTHVASTIAGTNEKYRGVAPGARIHSGKVCDASGSCAESAILAAMEWAATEVEARVVNMSLGGADTPELDPLEEAVNRLSAQTGSLFVIAAGNSGQFGARTIESPGSAEAALTVGAVDKSDQLAYFSSRGPRVGDNGLKPDLVAPGVDITAAQPGGGHQALSGTSMATPHTAGAAALLAQQHPDWKGDDLKVALKTSAEPLAGLTPFEQGSGRLDVARATQQKVVLAVPHALGFGVALWPHADDKPVTKQVTYRNLGDQPVTLKVAAALTGPDGKPAPEGALTLGATEVTVPAGGSGTVDVSSDTRHNGPDGAYAGRVTATGPGITLTTPLTVTKEVESYTLTVHLVPPDVSGPSSSQVGLIGHGNDMGVWLDVNGSIQRRVPKGRYVVEGYHLLDPWTEHSKVFDLIQPNVTITADTAITLDLRKTKPIDLTVPAADAGLVLAEVSSEIPSAGYVAGTAAADLTRLNFGQDGTPLPAGQFLAWIGTQWAKPDAAGGFGQSPYEYRTLNRFPHGLPTGLTRRVQPAELTVVDQSLNHTSHGEGGAAVSGLPDGFTAPHAGPSIRYPLPATRKLHLEKGNIAWATDLTEYGERLPVSTAIGRWRTYPADRLTREQVNVAAFGPGPMEAIRSGDQLSVFLSAGTDATGAFGETVADSQSARLLRDGAELARSDEFRHLSTTGLPAEAARYTLEATLDRSSTAKFATKVDARWSFTSSATQKTLPLLGVRYQPKVDQNNLAARTAVTSLPVVVDPLPGSQLPVLRGTTVEYSGDNGTTWKKATLSRTGPGQYRAVFPTPEQATTISLRFHTTDKAGNSTDLTSIAAYHLR